MNMGTRSLLFGAHQFLIHPILVCKAWRELYGRLNFKTFLCILVHDWGYWGCEDMDGSEGMYHPLLGGRLVQHLGAEYTNLCLCHSRDFAALLDCEPSRLCWADKYSFCFEAPWFYILRTRITGELREYRAKAAVNRLVPGDVSDKEWFHRLSMYLEDISIEKAAQENTRMMQSPI